MSKQIFFFFNLKGAPKQTTTALLASHFQKVIAPVLRNRLVFFSKNSSSTFCLQNCFSFCFWSRVRRVKIFLFYLPQNSMKHDFWAKFDKRQNLTKSRQKQERNEKKQVFFVELTKNFFCKTLNFKILRFCLWI